MLVLLQRVLPGESGDDSKGCNMTVVIIILQFRRVLCLELSFCDSSLQGEIQGVLPLLPKWEYARTYTNAAVSCAPQVGLTWG